MGYSQKILDLINQKGGIQLDIGCGARKQGADWVGIDMQNFDTVDITHDLNVHPWPLPDNCVVRAIASHIMEHVPKVVIDNGRTRFPFIEFMDEVHRIMKPGGEFAIAAPHGYSVGYMQDPTHASPLCEVTWVYFTPEHPFYDFYRPKPWKIKFINWDPSANIEVLLTKMEVKNE